MSTASSGLNSAENSAAKLLKAKTAKKAVMVTGGTKRIGFEICKHFAQQGFNVAIHYNSSIALAQTAKAQLEQTYNISCQIFQANLASPQEAQTCINQAIKHFGQIDVLINNASFFEESTAVETSLENLMENFNVHYFSPFILCQAFASQPNLENGLVINMLDCNINRTQTKHFAYLQAKKALLSLTQNLACTLAPKIRTNAISPGFIIPEENTTVTEKYTAHKLKQIPLQKQGSTQDIIAAVHCLHKSPYLNGQNIFVDGGSHLLTI